MGEVKSGHYVINYDTLEETWSPNPLGHQVGPVIKNPRGRPRKPVRSRGYAFTQFKITYEVVDFLIGYGQYICFGFEICPTTHREHIQGFVYFNQQRTFSAVCDDMPGVHFEAAKGSVLQNEVYTSKEGIWYEFGDKPHQGKAKNELIIEAMKEPMENIHLYNTYRRAYNEVKRKAKPSLKDRRIVVIEFDRKYNYIDSMKDQYTITTKYECYDGEQLCVFSGYSGSTSDILDWLHGIPPLIKNGYELTRFDPDIVALTYSGRPEEAFIHKTYSSFIDYNGVQKEKSSEEATAETETCEQTETNSQ